MLGKREGASPSGSTGKRRLTGLQRGLILLAVCLVVLAGSVVAVYKTFVKPMEIKQPEPTPVVVPEIEEEAEEGEAGNGGDGNSTVTTQEPSYELTVDEVKALGEAVFGIIKDALSDPESLKKLFTQAFTVGISSPNRRVTENKWLDTFANLMSGIAICPHCGAEVFYDQSKADMGIASLYARAANSMGFSEHAKMVIEEVAMAAEERVRYSRADNEKADRAYKRGQD